MSWGIWILWLPALPMTYVLGSILGTLRTIHKELVRIRLATESLHDLVVREGLMRRFMGP